MVKTICLSYPGSCLYSNRVPVYRLVTFCSGIGAELTAKTLWICTVPQGSPVIGRNVYANVVIVCGISAGRMVMLRR